MMDAIQKSFGELQEKIARMGPVSSRTYWKADDFEALMRDWLGEPETPPQPFTSEPRA